MSNISTNIENRIKKETKVMLPRSFYLAIIGDVISRIGDYIYQLAIPLYVLSLTNSSIWMGVTFAIQQSAIVLSGLVSGVIVDRNSPRKVILINSIVQALLISLIPVFNIWGLANVYIIIIIGFFLESFGFLYRTGINSLVPCIVSKSKLPMASAQISFSKFFSKTFGPTIGGFIIGILSPINSLWVDTVSFIVIFIMMTFIRENNIIDLKSKADSEKTSFVNDIKEGFKIVISTNYVFSLILLNFMLNIGYVGIFSMFVFHLKSTLGLSSIIIGFIYSANGIGTLLAGFTLPILMKKVKNGRLILLTSLLLGISIFLLGYISNIFIVGLLFGIVMYCSQTINRTMYTLWQMNIARDKLGRIFSISSMLESISVPIAGAIYGVVANIYGSFFLMKISGIIILIVSIIFLLFTSISKIDNTEVCN